MAAAFIGPLLQTGLTVAPAIIDLVGKYRNAQNYKKALFDTVIGSEGSIYNQWSKVEPGASHVLNLARKTAAEVLTARAESVRGHRLYGPF